MIRLAHEHGANHSPVCGLGWGYGAWVAVAAVGVWGAAEICSSVPIAFAVEWAVVAVDCASAGPLLDTGINVQSGFQCQVAACKWLNLAHREARYAPIIEHALSSFCILLL